jgi:hypothetical protein
MVTAAWFMREGWGVISATQVLNVQPGDLFVVDPQEAIFDYIETGEKLIDHRKLKQHPGLRANWGHVGIASRRIGGTLMIVEAEPGGAVERPWHWEDQPYLWSTGILPACPMAAYAAMKYAGFDRPASGMGWVKARQGVGYSLLDYAAIEAHHLHLPVPGLRGYIASTKHQICSQLGDQCRQDGGSHLFDDDRWPGYVTPLDIGMLLEGVQ